MLREKIEKLLKKEKGMVYLEVNKKKMINFLTFLSNILQWCFIPLSMKDKFATNSMICEKSKTYPK